MAEQEQKKRGRKPMNDDDKAKGVLIYLRNQDIAILEKLCVNKGLNRSRVISELLAEQKDNVQWVYNGKSGTAEGRVAGALKTKKIKQEKKEENELSTSPIAPILIMTGLNKRPSVFNAMEMRAVDDRKTGKRFWIISEKLLPALMPFAVSNNLKFYDIVDFAVLHPESPLVPANIAKRVQEQLKTGTTINMGDINDINIWEQELQIFIKESHEKELI